VDPTTLTSGRSGTGCPAVVFRGAAAWAAALIFVLGACERPGAEERAVLELEHDTITLEPGIRVMDIVLRSAPAGPEPDPVSIRPGDVVRFIAADALLHTVAFDRHRLSTAAEAFLTRTDQLRGPPLLAAGARWVVSFEGAPPGDYPYIDQSHDRGGVIVVIAEEPPRGRAR